MSVLGELDGEFSHGLCLIADPEADLDRQPTAANSLVTWSKSSMAIGVAHEQFGSAIVRVIAAPFSSDLHLVHEGTITTDSGRLQLSNVAMTMTAEFETSRGLHSVSVYADDDREPELVEIVFN